MYIEQAAQAPNGAALTIHRIQKLDIRVDGSTAIVNSYTDLENPLIGWQAEVAFPLTALSADPMLSVAEYFVGPTGYLPGGAIVHEPDPDPDPEPEPDPEP